MNTTWDLAETQRLPKLLDDLFSIDEDDDRLVRGDNYICRPVIVVDAAHLGYSVAKHHEIPATEAWNR